LCGCAATSPGPAVAPDHSDVRGSTQEAAFAGVSNEPIGLQLRKSDPNLNDVRFNSVLNFEGASDLIFIKTDPDRSAELDSKIRFTGTSSVRLSSQLRQLNFRLPALVGSSKFPGKWNLIGPYLRSEERSAWELSYVVDGVTGPRRKVELLPGQWTLVTVDLASLGVVESVGDLVLSRVGPAGGELWVDDLLMVDNSSALVDTREAAPEQFPWVIRRSGFKIAGEASGRFGFTLQTPEATPEGWTVVEAGPMRCRFVSAGRSKTWTIYADGRAYRDGRFEPVAKLGGVETQLAQQHDNPAELGVSDEQGRVERTTEGDRNNDGYNEARGSYVVGAAGARIEIRLTPRGGPVYRPMLEISGLPIGETLITVEGRLVDRAVRTAEGTLLVDVPLKIERETVVNVNVR